jgi:scyllo-inositol 2-dehydrogenase (NADP+)
MKKFGLAVIGTGWITAAFIQAARMSEAYELLAVYSRSLEKGQPFAEANRIPKVYTDFEEMLKDETIDVVYIASPNDMHYPQAKQVLLAGKDAIGEKPLVSTLREMEDLVNVMESTGKIAVEALTLRHVPNLQIIKDNLSRIGALRLVRADMSQFSSRYPALKQGNVTNVFDPAHSGGALYDIGIYPLSLVLSVLGKPLTTTYHANKHANGIDLSGLLVMEYPETKVVCSFSKDCFGPNGVVFEGEDGYLQIDGAPSRVSNVTLVTPQGKQELGVAQVEQTMFYEACAFAQLLDSRDPKLLKNLTRHSLILADIMEESRKEAGVAFKADQR